MSELHWKMGFEIELLAPRGKSREDIAKAIAIQTGGWYKRCFYPQSEPSAVPGTPVFENLILGFDAYDKDGELVVRCVDDLTIRRDLSREATSLDGWYRILSDDSRLLRLIMEQCDPDADRQSVLAPIAKLFGTELAIEEDFVRLADRTSSPIALAAPLPGERERPCELITPPIEKDHEARLEALLGTARELKFSVPHEAAVHIHFDGERLCDTRVFCQLVQVLRAFGPELRKVVGTNPNCVRLGPIPDWLYKLTKKPDFQALDWVDASNTLKVNKLTKYSDFNFMNFIYSFPGKSTFEVRIFPGTLATHEILERAALFEAILDWCVRHPSPHKLPRKFKAFASILSDLAAGSIANSLSGRKASH